jgi:hypothetical protein
LWEKEPNLEKKLKAPIGLSVFGEALYRSKLAAKGRVCPLPLNRLGLSGARIQAYMEMHRRRSRAQQYRDHLMVRTSTLSGLIAGGLYGKFSNSGDADKSIQSEADRIQTLMYLMHSQTDPSVIPPASTTGRDMVKEYEELVERYGQVMQVTPT